jgi:hypothetical protein
MFIYDLPEDRIKRKNMRNWRRMMVTNQHKAQAKVLYKAQIQKRMQEDAQEEQLPRKLNKIQAQDQALDSETQLQLRKIMFLKVVMRNKLK